MPLFSYDCLRSLCRFFVASVTKVVKKKFIVLGEMGDGRFSVPSKIKLFSLLYLTTFSLARVVTCSTEWYDDLCIMNWVEF